MFTHNNKELKLKNVFLREYLNSSMSKVAFKEACDNIITLAQLYDNRGIMIERNLTLDDGTITTSYKRLTVPLQEELSSTPLNEALLALAPITKAFKTKNNLEIVSTVIIQDGDSDSPPNTYFDEGNSAYGSTYGSPIRLYSDNIIINDKINSKIFQEKFTYDYDSFPNLVLKWYSAYTETTVVGFFLMDSGQARKVVQKLTVGDASNRTKIRSELKENRFVVTDRVGYSKFFYIMGGSVLSDDSKLTIDSDMSVSKIKSNFLKNNKKKLTNRSLVTKLIEEISV
jgi:hypothetical protein